MFTQAEQDLDDATFAPREFRENCAKCKGQGRFIGYNGRALGKCYACDGAGFKMRKTSSETRARATEQRHARKAKSEAETLEFFAEQYPEIAAWIEGARETFEFAAAMREAIIKFGDLTERQIAACQKCIESRKAATAARADRVANAPTIETDRLMTAFDAAKAAGLKRPKMRFEGFTASLAPAGGANAGAIYLKDGETYLGKIAAGKFLASRDCEAGQTAAIQAAMADPLASAIAFGRRTGACSCCGRELTDPVSIEAGIGPVCAEKFSL